MYSIHTKCRACGNDELTPVLDMGVQPLANDFRRDYESHAGFAPLKVLYCPACSLAQLSVVVDPKILYSNYSYVTSASDTMKHHFAALWKDLNAEKEIKSVVEIGSNTGDFLAYCLGQGARRVVGIDPARNLCLISEEKEAFTICSEFGQQSALAAKERVNEADLVIARHVFCHIDNWREFISNLKILGGAETIYCIEVPCTPDMLAINSWDQIYHEHLSYLTIRAIKALLAGSGLHVHNVQRYPIHGGAILITLRRDESCVAPHPEICAEVGMEHVTLDDWRKLSSVSIKQRFALLGLLEQIISDGRRIGAMGASAKSTVWINACNLTRRHIQFIADNTPQKQLTFSPGTDIPIVDEGAIMRELPDYVVLFAWNFQDEILQKFSLAREKGVKFIVPVPELAIV